MKLVLISLILLAFSTTATGQLERDKGIELYRLGEFSEAIKIFERLQENGHADDPTRTYLGAAYVKTGRNDHAIEVFRKIDSFGVLKSPVVYDRDIKFNKKPAAKFDKAVKLAERAGRVRLAVEFKQDGRVGFILPFSTTSEKLLEGAFNAATSIRFDPAIRDGKPVSVVMIVEYSFEIM